MIAPYTGSSRAVLASVGMACAASSALAQSNEISIDMDGIEIAFPFNDQTRDSLNNPMPGSDTMINLADGYEFEVSGNARVVIFFIEFYNGPIEPLFNFLEPGLGSVLKGFVRAPGGLPGPGQSTWQESFSGGLFGAELSVTLEYDVQPDGVVQFNAVDISSDLGVLGQIEFSNAEARLAGWTPSDRQVTEWSMNGDLSSVDGSANAAVRYMDDPAFGTILIGEDNEAVPDPSVPTGVTEAQSSFRSTADDASVPAINGEEDTYLLTSPAFNTSDPASENLRRGLGLALAPMTKPDYPSNFVGQWTLIWDLLIPASSWYSDFPANTSPNDFLAALFQNSSNNDDGADIFLRTDGPQPGIIYSNNGDSFSSGFLPLNITPDTWFRLALVGNEFQTQSARVYLDGVFVGTIGADWASNAVDRTNPTFSDGEMVDPLDWDAWGQFPSPWARSTGAMNPGPEGNPIPAPMNSTFGMFADLRFGGSQPVAVANMLFADDLLSDTEIADLGGPDAAGILLGGGGCNAADLAEPLGTLDFNDVIAFLSAFGAGDPVADFSPPMGVLDFNDVIAFLTIFGQGCP